MKHPVPIRPAYSVREPPHFVRACFAATVAAAGVRGFRGGAEATCARLYPDDPTALRLLQKAAVDGASTSAAGWAEELAGTAFQRFLASLEPLSAASRLIASGMPVSFDGVAEIRIPVRATGPAGLPWVGEGQAIPLRARTFGAVTVGPPRKFGAIVAFTKELATRADALPIFEMTLKEDAALALDAAYFSSDAGTTDAHVGLLFALTPLTADQSETAKDAMLGDLAAVASSVGAAGSGQTVFVTGPGRAAKISILAPTMSDRVWASLAVPEDRLIGIDPASLVHGFGAIPEISASTETTLHMSDAATAIGTAGSPAVIAEPTVSMFQTAQVALRILTDVAFAARRSGAVAYVDDIVNW